MTLVGDFLADALLVLGPSGLLLALYAIFVVDATLVPTVPEVFAVLFLAESIALGWDPLAFAPLLLAAAVAGELTGNGALYLVVRKALVEGERMPAVIERTMRKWTGFLVVSDERLILVNRVAPVVPMVGAFVATLGWPLRRSFAYIAGGGTAKYGALLAVVGLFGLVVDPEVLSLASLVLVAAVLAASAVASILYRRRLRRPARRSD